ncbi:acetyl-CoA carboxylase biotin carboxyl carrier protein [Limosilactobacillus viscerum]|uniref:acetyl-CoA carboxylase biotin carboxyl carrier protein n=1 Tax=Limosilactobacillus viscerum TaxID=2993450 RepID=UPI0024B8F5FB|nr:biotin/lipoyl-containing protein [Limosilactobacillus viscerum]
MEFNDIQKLMTGFEKSSTRELKIDDQDFHLYLSKNENSVVSPAEQGTTAKPGAVSTEAPAEKQASSVSIKAPLVGTVYLQPKPNKPAYVKTGDHVHKGDVVCVIEAMKMLTEVKSDHDGIIESVNVENGDLVEFDQPLFTITEG